MQSKFGFRPVAGPLILDRQCIVVADQDLSNLWSIRDKLKPDSFYTHMIDTWLNSLQLPQNLEQALLDLNKVSTNSSLRNINI